MPGQLFNLKRYFKKKDKTEEPVAPEAPQSFEPQVKTGQTTVVKTETKQESAGMVPYSGIGYPPAGTATKKTTKTTVTKTPPEEKPPETKGTTADPGDTSPPGPTTKPTSSKSHLPPTTPVMSRRVGMDVLTRLTQRSNQALLKAVNKAKQLSIQYIDTEHVLWSLLQDSGIYQLISDLKATPSEIQAFLEKDFKKGDFKPSPQFSPRVKRVLELSLSAARSLGYEFISPEHLLLALAQEGEGAAAQALTKFGIAIVDLNKKITGKKEGVTEEEKGKGSSLEQFCDDLTQKAQAGKLDPVVGRAAEIERIIHILSRRTKNNPVLIGDAGVGKTAIVEGLAQRIATSDVPETLLNKRILSLDLMSLVAGARHRGEFEQRLKNLLKEIQAGAGQIILFIDEIQNMVGAGSGSEGTLDVSNIMKPSLARGELQAIGTTTVSEYRKYIEKDPALERRFQPIQVTEPTVDQALEMLRALRDKYEAFHKVSITDEAIGAAVRLSQKYIGDRFLPDKAVDLIDEAASAVRLPAISLPEEIKSLQEKIARFENEKKEAEKLKDNIRLASLDRDIADAKASLAEKTKAYEKRKSMTTNVVGPEIIADIVSRWTGIPISRLTESESEKLLKLEDLIGKRYINQEEAVAAISEAVRRGRAGLTSGKRPIGSFIFMGPTGVGKTELCKVLADILFGSPDLMIRLDMSEYMEKHEVSKLIGAPPGYVGYEEGGQLTEAVRRHPYSVVLLDEIEKAHPDVFNILLQILDDGRLTDNKGHLISFKNAIICCTSNIGTQLIQREMLEDGETPSSAPAPALSTYAITPTGREMITSGNRYWVKTKSGKSWEMKLLSKYFAGCEVKEAGVSAPSSKLPADGFDCQVFAPNGEERIVFGARLWWRKSPIAKEWETTLLVDHFKKSQVIGAAPDDPSQALPTAKIETWAISSDGFEVISFGDRVWQRLDQKSNEWETKSLTAYLEGSPELTLPTQKWDVHLFTPRDGEILISGHQFWKTESKKAKEWKTGQLSDYFVVKKVGGEKASQKDWQLPLGQEKKKTKKEHQKTGDEKFAALAAKLIGELKKFFRPEVLNRFDEVIVFRALSVKNMLQIVELQFKDLAKRMEEQSLGLEVTPAAKQQIADLGYDPVYGARPLRRAIQRHIENAISSLIIKEGVKAGEMVQVDFDGDEFVFDVKRPLGLGEMPPTVVAKTERYVCLDCGKEFEKSVEGGPARQGFATGEAGGEMGRASPEALPAARSEKREEKEMTSKGKTSDGLRMQSSEVEVVPAAEATEEQVKDTMMPAAANFVDDPAQPLEEKPVADNPAQTGASTTTDDPPAGRTSPKAMPTARGQDLQQQINNHLTSPVASVDNKSSQLDKLNIPESQIVCPSCGSTNVKPIEEASDLPVSTPSLPSQPSELSSPSSPSGPSVPPEEEGLKAFYGTEEPPEGLEEKKEEVEAKPSIELPVVPSDTPAAVDPTTNEPSAETS